MAGSGPIRSRTPAALRSSATRDRIGRPGTAKADASVERNGRLLVGMVVDFPNGLPHLVEITRLPCLGPEGSVWPAGRVAAPDNSAREKLNPVQGTANLVPTRLVRWDSGS
jgi:hypothetical protein